PRCQARSRTRARWASDRSDGPGTARRETTTVRIGSVSVTRDSDPSLARSGSARAGELAKLHRSVPIERYRSLVGHWIARWFRPPAPARLEPLPAVKPGTLALTFGGHATVLARYPSLSIAFDPMLGRWVGGVRRAVEPGLAPGD